MLWLASWSLMTRAMVTTSTELSSAALPALDLVKTPTRVDGSRLQGLKKGAKIRFHFASHSGTVDEGPILCGFASGGITAAEIEEMLDADPQSEFDIPANEQSLRRVYPVAMVEPGVNTENQGMTRFGSLTWPWEIPEGDALDFWIFNTGSATISADGSVVKCFAIVNGEWRDD